MGEHGATSVQPTTEGALWAFPAVYVQRSEPKTNLVFLHHITLMAEG